MEKVKVNCFRQGHLELFQYSAEGMSSIWKSESNEGVHEESLKFDVRLKAIS